MTINHTNNYFKNIFIILIITILIILSTSTINFYSNQSKNPEIDGQSQNHGISTEYNTYKARSGSSYSYHNYSSLVSDLQNLNSSYPALMEMFTVQDRFGLPDCKDGYEVWVARITNENLGFNKPEVLFIGGHHGDEDISVEAPYYLIQFLLENYGSNDFIRYLLDNREIYVMPVINPWGWENNVREDSNNEDVNRDYPYGIEAGNYPLTTVGAQAVAEFMKHHLFILSLTWHSGEHLIYYAWGTPKHDTPTDESPDNLAFFEVAKLMSENSGDVDKYPYGPANQMFSYSAFGAWSDYAYAATWDTKYLFSGYETPSALSLAFGIEISKEKRPAESLLGNSNEVFNPDDNMGFISKNIRMALILIDLAEPYLEWQNSSTEPIPTTAEINNDITLNWFVNGSFSVTRTNIQYGTDPNPISNFKYSTEDLTGDSHWTGESFSQKLTLPTEPGDYYFVAHAVVDQNSRIQYNPEPNVLPQSFFVNQRTNESWTVKNNGNSMKGKKDWYSRIIHVKVTGAMKNNIEIINYTEPAYSNQNFNLSWQIKSIGSVNHTELHWGQDFDLINHSEFITFPGGSYTSKTSNGATIYYANFTLPAHPGVYYFAARMNLLSNSSNKTNNKLDYWSQIIQIEIVPKKPYLIKVSTPIINYIGENAQTLALKSITCTNQTISDEPLNDSLMSYKEAIITRFDIDTFEIINNTQYTFELEWSAVDNYWFLPTMNISSWDPGGYLVSCKFEHRYGIGQSSIEINDDSNNWFILEHVIVVNPPIAVFIRNDNETKLLNILNVTAWCSKSQLGYLDNLEANKHNFQIQEVNTEKQVFNGTITWNPSTQTWETLNLNITHLEPGDYFVTCTFSVLGIANGNSQHSPGDQTEFTIPLKDRDLEKDKDQKNEPTENYLILVIIVALILIIFLIFMISIIRIRKKY